MHRDIRIGLLINPLEKETLDRLVKYEGEAMAVVMRRLIRQEAKNKGLWPEKNNHIKEKHHAT